MKTTDFHQASVRPSLNPSLGVSIDRRHMIRAISVMVLSGAVAGCDKWNLKDFLENRTEGLQEKQEREAREREEQRKRQEEADRPRRQQEMEKQMAEIMEEEERRLQREQERTLGGGGSGGGY